MPVRQPTAKLRKGKKKVVQAPESRVRGIKNDGGWENAMKASDRRYVLVHVLGESNSGSGMNFKVQFSRMSATTKNSHMIFAEASVRSCKALKDYVKKQGLEHFPLVLAYHRRRCIKALSPSQQLPTSVLGGAFGGFFQLVKRTVDELADQAPKPTQWKSLAIKVFMAMSALSVGSVAAVKHPKISSLLNQGNNSDAESDGSSNAFQDVLEFDLAFEDEFDIDDPEDPMTLP